MVLCIHTVYINTYMMSKNIYLRVIILINLAAIRGFLPYYLGGLAD